MRLPQKNFNEKLFIKEIHINIQTEILNELISIFQKKI